MRTGPRPFQRQQHRAAPFAADTDTLDQAQQGQNDRAPDADRRVARYKTYGEGSKAGHQQRRDQRRLAPDAVAIMAENRGADWTDGETDGVDREGLQGAHQRIGSREIQFPEGERRHQTVGQEVIGFDYRSDGAGDHGATQGRTVLGVGQAGGGNFARPPRAPPPSDPPLSAPRAPAPLPAPLLTTPRAETTNHT